MKNYLIKGNIAKSAKQGSFPNKNLFFSNNDSNFYKKK